MFDGFSVAQAEAAPVDSCPPDSWKGVPGRKGKDKVCLQMAVTLYAKVRHEVGTPIVY